MTPASRPTADRPSPGRFNPMVLGVALAVVGVLLLANNLSPVGSGILGLGSWLAFAGPGVVFLAVYFFHTRHLGFLIPGAILTGLGALLAAEGVEVLPQAMPQSAGLFFLFLGLPFLFVWYVHTRRLQERQDRLWPLYPGVLLTGLAAVFLVLETVLSLRGSRWAFAIRMWPLLLMLVGLSYMLRARKPKWRSPAKSAASMPETHDSREER